MIALNQIGQISLSVSDVDAAETFYSDVLGLRKLYRYGDLLFYDCSGVRLFIEKSSKIPFKRESSAIYFRCLDISLAYKDMKSRGVEFTDEPHLIAQMGDHDLWMVFFLDPSGNTLALMQEAPKGYVPWP